LKNNNHIDFNRLNSNLWQRARIDKFGRLTLPQSLRERLGINDKKSEILFISIVQGSQDNIFNLEIGVKKR